MAYNINRQCIACRKMIPSDSGVTILAFLKVITKFVKKTNALTGDTKEKEVVGLCPECTEQFDKIIAGQQEKGMKVL